MFAIAAARDRFAASGVAEMGVDYWAFNSGAARFFARHGFVPRRHIAFAPIEPR